MKKKSSPASTPASSAKRGIKNSEPPPDFDEAHAREESFAKWAEKWWNPDLPSPAEPMRLDGAKLRVPPEFDGVQVNFCKNPLCENFGVPAEDAVERGPGAQNRYTIVSAGKHYPHLRCNACQEHAPIKSNQGVAEELARLRAAAAGKPEPSCPNGGCANHGEPVSRGKELYSSFGTTSTGAPRWKCKGCGKTFSAAKSATTRQRDTHKNKEVFKLLVNKMPLRRIMEVAEISAAALYGKIDFLHRQCVAFMADREAKLPGLAIPRLYLGVDRQDFVSNWTRREDRRNIVLSAVASVDNGTGYCFGSHLNFDPGLDPAAVAAESAASGDQGKAAPFRRHARTWSDADYAAAVSRSANQPPPSSLQGKVANAYAKAARREDVESPDSPSQAERLPEAGMQIHSEYTLYGHFLWLRGMFAGVEKVRFFLDQDAGMRAACLSAFAADIRYARTVDAFFVSISKNLTVDQKRRKKREAAKELLEYMGAHPKLDREEAMLAMIKERLAEMALIGKWRDRWLLHPFPSMSEPEKAICYLTDMRDYDADHLAWLYNKASLHAVDNYFMQTRRRLMPLERALNSQGNAGRVWNGYAPYNPSLIVKLLGIFRAFHNFIHVGQDKQTPAMRLGLARGPVKYEDVIYFTAQK